MTPLGRRTLNFVLLAFFVPLSAQAATDVHASKRGVLPVATQKVIDVLSSNEICDEGCRYYGPHITREKKIQHKATSTSFYKWTHVSGVKTVKFFKHIKITPGKVTKITIRTLNKERDGGLIAELEKLTGLPHEPLFDASHAIYTLKQDGKSLKVHVSATTRVSGLISLLKGTVRKEMHNALNAMFGNFQK